MSLCPKEIISKKALTAHKLVGLIFPPTQEFYPHRWLNNFIKMLS
jgi:hypothetical protein